MAHRLSRKFIRDADRLAGWRARGPGTDRSALEAIQISFQGRIILPGDPDYDTERKLFNPWFQDYPSVIFMCVCETDVRFALAFADLSPSRSFTVRSGGHSTAGYSASDGVLIDVSALDNIAIAPGGASVTVGCGCAFETLIPALDQAGLHVPVGECGDVRVGGFVQGGGYGFTSGAFGMNCDNAIGFRVMLADGSIVAATPSVNADLWWALRGGTGGNFGIVLDVTYRLRPLTRLYGWAIAFPLDSAADRANATAALLALQAGYMRTAPAGLTTQVSICYQPSDPHGGGGPLTPWLLFRGTYAGANLSRGPTLIAPLRSLAGAVTQFSGTASFGVLNDKLLNDPYSMPPIPPSVGMPCEDKQARYVARDLTAREWRAILDLFVARAPSAGNLWSYMYLEVYGGAINAYPPADSAFVHRDAAFSACLDVFWRPGDDPAPARAFLGEWVKLMETLWNGHIYQNYPNPNVPDYRWNYWGDAFHGLLRVKDKYDPTQLFAFAQMVSPYTPGETPAGRAATLPPGLADALAAPIAVARPGFAAGGPDGARGFVADPP